MGRYIVLDRKKNTKNYFKSHELSILLKIANNDQYIFQLANNDQYSFLLAMDGGLLHYYVDFL